MVGPGSDRAARFGLQGPRCEALAVGPRSQGSCRKARASRFRSLALAERLGPRKSGRKTWITASNSTALTARSGLQGSGRKAPTARCEPHGNRICQRTGGSQDPVLRFRSTDWPQGRIVLAPGPRLVARAVVDRLKPFGPRGSDCCFGGCVGREIGAFGSRTVPLVARQVEGHAKVGPPRGLSIASEDCPVARLDGPGPGSAWPRGRAH